MTKQEVYKLIEEHYRTHSKNLENKIIMRAGQQANAQDIVQEAYAKALQYWNSFNPETGSIDKWIGSILFNAASSFYRQEILRGMVVDTGEDVVEQPNAPSRIMVKEVEKYIGNLPTGSRKTVAELFFLKDYSCREISDVCPETPSAIRKIVQRLREDMRVVLIREVK